MVQKKTSEQAESLQAAEPVRIDERIPIPVRSSVPPPQGAPSPDHLTIHHELGRGGMGRVHVATDRNLARQVALKYLSTDYAGNAFYRDGFVAEAQITGQLEHPNIVPVHELAVDRHGVTYFTMKYVRGESFQDWLWSPERPPGSTERLEQGLEIFLKVCDAVAYAHHRGVLHRDLKPDNIMVGDFGQVYLMDWGLSRVMDAPQQQGTPMRQMDAPGAIGTPHFMSPEQAQGDVDGVDERSDIFGLGGLLYEIITGQPPYGDVPADVALARAKKGAVLPMSEACAGIGVSGRIRAIAEKATHPDREQRYQTVIELQRDVRRFLQGGLHLPRRAYAPGTAIVTEGDPGDAAYLLVSGTCRAYRTVDGKQNELSKIHAGEVFGEMALLTGERRVATVEAVDRVTVLVLDKDTITEGLGTEGWTGALVRALASRFRALLVNQP